MTAAGIARELGLPRSSAYHLLAALEAEGFVVHYPEEERYGLGVAAFEIGTAYLRQEPMQRMARPLLTALARRAGEVVACVAHVGVLHGRETLYLAREESPRGPVTVVADVGVRLPASLTASGRSMLAKLPPVQVRALFPEREQFVDRTGRGPMSPRALTALLREESQRGWAREDGFITDGLSSIAAAAVDRSGRPTAAVGVTFRSLDVEGGDAIEKLAGLVKASARELSRRLG